MNQFEYPRPQLVRDHWISLNGPWRFMYDDARRCQMPDCVDGWTHEIEVPFAPETKASGIGDTGFHSVCWYQREFTLLPGVGRTILHFGAIDYSARVWVNDHLVAEHEGGHTPFCADIATLLTQSGPQVIVVRAEDRPDDLQQPRGKQYWEL